MFSFLKRFFIFSLTIFPLVMVLSSCVMVVKRPLRPAARVGVKPKVVFVKPPRPAVRLEVKSKRPYKRAVWIY